jgi:hypothetical protein
MGHACSTEDARISRRVKPYRGEYILCAAIWVDDGKEHPHQPVSTGVVLAGHRHHNILNAMAALMEPIERGTAKKTQGFLTSMGEFVDRKEALRLAAEARQIAWTPGDPLELFSEDLY